MPLIWNINAPPPSIPFPALADRPTPAPTSHPVFLCIECQGSDRETQTKVPRAA